MATENSSACRRLKNSKQTSHSPLSTEDSLRLPHLPLEIIIEVLSRLPVKSLLRFRCVSKSWRSLISQPEFAKTHLRLASTNTDYTLHRLLLCSSLYFKSCSLYSILNEKSDTAVELDCPLKGAHSTIWIVGCCYGLVCIAAGNEVSIWNPSTRKSKRLPNVKMANLYRGTYGFDRGMYGFGYDESIDDYKVVGAFHDVGNSGFEAEVKVYSLRTNSWRRIGGFPDRIPLTPHGSGTCVSGALHWFSTGDCRRIIVSLDLVKETYGEVSEPDYRDGILHQVWLDALNGCLCVLGTYRDFVDVWVMKEYGTRESWTKFVVIPYVSHPCDNLSRPLLWTLKNGEVLMRTYTHLVRYNPKDGTFNYPVFWYIVCSYVESLFSPDIDAESGIQRQQPQCQC
ncbi:hypothetical protein RHMOL_Rhmol02G0060300 [Rhododendron molle]|uniref:Uncharacterized protein n=1 Tax=Rhododendron molle TaxID=49168 RepID=A0ACC0PNH5_RHOML|nr:hypothetical protein RHMOL_Rhmol02G0060300 [Rhododendron molle]